MLTVDCYNAELCDDLLERQRIIGLEYSICYVIKSQPYITNANMVNWGSRV